MRDLKHIEVIFDEINVHLMELKEISGVDFMKWTSQVQTYQTLIKNLVIESSQKQHLLDSFSIIIRNLQFHDIIEQQIEHIIEINKLILDMNLGEFKEPFLAKFLHLQLELLANIQTEYETSSRSIRTKLVTIWNEPKIETQIDKNIDIVFNGTYTFIKKRLMISMSLENIKLEHQTLDWNDEKYSEEIQQIRNQFSMAVEREIFDQIYGLKTDEEDTGGIQLF